MTLSYGADFGEIGHRYRSKAATFSGKAVTLGWGEWSNAELRPV